MGSGERGVSLAEVTIVMVIIAMLITVTMTYTIPWLGREEMRGAIYQVQEYLQLARILAVSRNRSCQFVLNTATRQVQIYDLNDPASTTDDILLYTLTIPASVAFARPDGGSAVTLAVISGTLYQATFTSSGGVSAGAGLIAMQGGDGSYRVNLYGAGGVRVEHWDGSAWVAGS